MANRQIYFTWKCTLFKATVIAKALSAEAVARRCSVNKVFFKRFY